MEEENKEHEHEPAHEPMHEPSHKKSNFTEKIRENPWMLATFILAVLTIILLVATFSGSLTGNVVSKEKAANNLITYLDKNIDSNITLINVTENSGLYMANVGYKGQAIPVYITKDGSSYTTALVPMTLSASSSNTNTQQAEVPKTTKPTVELYVFAYCPYGLQMEKAILPVVTLLGNNIDFSIRQIGAMHGDFEKVEAERQLSIEKLYPDKYLAYVSAFAADSSCPSGDAACVATKVNAIYAKLGMDATTINNYMTANGETLYNAEVSNAESKGITGSPTMLINGVEAQPSSRSPEAIKGTICNAFSNVPSVCNQTLSTDSTSAGFGSSSSSSSTSSGTQCATA